jgi:hypothetical protein
MRLLEGNHAMRVSVTSIPLETPLEQETRSKGERGDLGK